MYHTLHMCMVQECARGRVPRGTPEHVRYVYVSYTYMCSTLRTCVMHFLHVLCTSYMCSTLHTCSIHSMYISFRGTPEHLECVLRSVYIRDVCCSLRTNGKVARWGTPMFGHVAALEGLQVTGKYRDRSMQHTCSRHAAWDPHRCRGSGSRCFMVEGSVFRV